MLHNIDVNSFEGYYHSYWSKYCTDLFQSFPHKINSNKTLERKNKATKERTVTVIITLSSLDNVLARSSLFMKSCCGASFPSSSEPCFNFKILWDDFLSQGKNKYLT